MRAWFQIVIAVVVLLVLVGGLTFFAHFSWTSDAKPDDQKGPVPKPDKPPLVFQQNKLPNPDEKPPPPEIHEFELNQPNHRDYWFTNPKTKPVAVGLADKKCACTDVQVAAFGAGEYREAYESWSLPACSLLGLLGGFGLESVGPTAAIRLVSKVAWQPLTPMMDGGGFLTIPAGDAELPTFGIVRLNFIGKEPKPLHLDVTLVMRQEGEAETRQQIVEPVFIVPPLRVFPGSYQLPDMGPRETRTIEFMCWSSTRPEFKLEVYEKNKDPCFVCEVIPIDDFQRGSMIPQEYGPSRIVSGYQVKVTVHERRSDKEQMDLGLFARQIVCRAVDVEEPATVLLTGAVHGEITVFTGDDKDRIELQSFPSSLGKKATATLSTDNTSLDLELLEVSPSYLVVKLKPIAQNAAAGRKEWRLEVEVPPNSPPGRLTGSAIVLKTNSNPPRKIRIPVNGIGFKR